jgi:hypothetical protein
MKYYKSIYNVFDGLKFLKSKEITTDFFFVLIIVILFSLQSSVTIILSYIASFIYLLKINGLKKVNRFVVFYWLIFSTLVSICIFQFNHGVTPIFYLILTPFIILSAKKIAYKPIEHIEIIITKAYLFFLFVILIGLIWNFNKPDPIAHIIPWSSQNGITSYLIVIHISYSIVYYLRYEKLPILLAFILLIITLYGLGRGSIIIAGLIFIISLFINHFLNNKNGLIRNLFFFPIYCIIIYLIYKQYLNYESEIDLIIERSKFSQNLADDPRKNMLNEYLKKLNIWSTIFGSSFEGTSIQKNYDGNPHNSFIRVHSFYGLIGLVSVFAPICLIFIKKIKFKTKVIFGVFIILLLTRAISEPILFPTTLDFFYSFNFFVFYSHRIEKKEKLCHI